MAQMQCFSRRSPYIARGISMISALPLPEERVLQRVRAALRAAVLARSGVYLYMYCGSPFGACASTSAGCICHKGNAAPPYPFYSPRAHKREVWLLNQDGKGTRTGITWWHVSLDKMSTLCLIGFSLMRGVTKRSIDNGL